MQRVIRQAITKDCLFNVIAAWCRHGASKTDHSLCVLSAFASGAGVTALSPLFDIFLAHGNRIEIICGIDRNGTDANAIRKLYGLKEAHHSCMAVSIFNAPSKGAIFHPKLYINDCGAHINFVIGSANMTSGGLADNFESLVLYKNIPKGSQLARQIWSIWQTFAYPQPPLSPGFLRPLTKKEKTRLVKKLPRKSHWEKHSTSKAVAKLWKPFSHVRWPHSERFRHRTKAHIALRRSKFLLMDVLTETRKTQMQIPLAVVRGFFGLARRQKAVIRVAMWSPDGFTQPIRRPIVKSEGPNRLMRRIEIPPIKMLKRNLAILFIKLKGRRNFVYRLFPRNTAAYRTANHILQQYGQEGGADRRYVMENGKDRLWPQINRLFRGH